MGGSHRLEGDRVTAGIDWGLSEVGPSKEFPHVRLVCLIQVLLYRWACACCSGGEGGLFSLKGVELLGCGRVGIRGEVSACKVNKREPRIPFSLASDRSPLLCFRYGYMALILKFKSFILVSQIWKEKEEKRERKGKYTVCFTWYVSSPSPGLPAVIFTAMDDSQCWAVCETVWQLQQFVWYSHIRWPKSCIYTKSQVISYKNYNS